MQKEAHACGLALPRVDENSEEKLKDIVPVES